MSNSLILELNAKVERLYGELSSRLDTRPPKGEKGDRGETGITGTKGDKGEQGDKGAKGEKGKDGKDGVSVVDANIDFDNHLTLTLSNGNEIDAGEIKVDAEGDTVIHSSTGRSITDEYILALVGDGMYTQLVDSDGVYKYIGEAVPSTATSAVGWRIKRIEYLTGDDFETKWANGSVAFDSVWDDRSTYVYS